MCVEKAGMLIWTLPQLLIYYLISIWPIQLGSQTDILLLYIYYSELLLHNEVKKYLFFLSLEIMYMLILQNKFMCFFTYLSISVLLCILSRYLKEIVFLEMKISILLSFLRYSLLLLVLFWTYWGA